MKPRTSLSLSLSLSLDLYLVPTNSFNFLPIEYGCGARRSREVYLISKVDANLHYLPILLRTIDITSLVELWCGESDRIPLIY